MLIAIVKAPNTVARSNFSFHTLVIIYHSFDFLPFNGVKITIYHLTIIVKLKVYSIKKRNFIDYKYSILSELFVNIQFIEGLHYHPLPPPNITKKHY